MTIEQKGTTAEIKIDSDTKGILNDILCVMESGKKFTMNRNHVMLSVNAKIDIDTETETLTITF